MTAPLATEVDPTGARKATVSPSAERVVVALILSFALASRLAMALFIPPWQGPDEPKHFEYPRLLIDLRTQLWAERRILNLGDASPVLEYVIIESMAEHDFWEYIGQPTPAVLPEDFDE